MAKAEEPIRLNIGCGTVTIPGYQGVDKVKTPAADYVCDVDKDKLPFKDNTVDAIRAERILEHLESVEHAMREFHRVLKPGGILEIKCPFYRHPSAVNPLHKNYWSWYSVSFWIGEVDVMDLEGKPHFDLVERYFLWENGKKFVPKSLGLYMKVLSHVMPARFVYFKLRKT